MNTNINLNVALQQPAGPLGIIRAQGADAVKFLQGQLTQDVALLGLAEARLAAWCSAKGRMLASFVVLKNTQDDILLICNASVLATTLKRLQMFVMRAQCKLTDATHQFELQGLAGSAIEKIAGRAGFAWVTSRNDAEITVQLPDGWHLGAAVPCAVRIRPVAGDVAATVSHSSPSTAADVQTLQPQADQSQADDLALWQYLGVTSGIAHITPPIADAFVPQMLNYESIGGVNFKKGCYPGQEVVARSQFRGTLKRRAYIVSSTMPLAAGQEVFDSTDPDQPCGTVASAAAVPGTTAQWLAIVSMQTRAAASPLSLAAAVGADGTIVSQGAALQLRPLPYALLEDI
jgi:tRNA-modifying protein YgfZ